MSLVQFFGSLSPKAMRKDWTVSPSGSHPLSARQKPSKTRREPRALRGLQQACQELRRRATAYALRPRWEDRSPQSRPANQPPPQSYLRFFLLCGKEFASCVRIGRLLQNVVVILKRYNDVMPTAIESMSQSRSATRHGHFWTAFTSRRLLSFCDCATLKPRPTLCR